MKQVKETYFWKIPYPQIGDISSWGDTLNKAFTKIDFLLYTIYGSARLYVSQTGSGNKTGEDENNALPFTPGYTSSDPTIVHSLIKSGKLQVILLSGTYDLSQHKSLYPPVFETAGVDVSQLGVFFGSDDTILDDTVILEGKGDVVVNFGRALVVINSKLMFKNLTFNGKIIAYNSTIFLEDTEVQELEIAESIFFGRNCKVSNNFKTSASQCKINDFRVGKDIQVESSRIEIYNLTCNGVIRDILVSAFCVFNSQGNLTLDAQSSFLFLKDCENVTLRITSGDVALIDANKLDCYMIQSYGAFYRINNLTLTELASGTGLNGCAGNTRLIYGSYTIIDSSDDVDIDYDDTSGYYDADTGDKIGNLPEPQIETSDITVEAQGKECYYIRIAGRYSPDYGNARDWECRAGVMDQYWTMSVMRACYYIADIYRSVWDGTYSRDAYIHDFGHHKRMLQNYCKVYQAVLGGGCVLNKDWGYTDFSHQSSVCNWSGIVYPAPGGDLFNERLNEMLLIVKDKDLNDLIAYINHLLNTLRSSDDFSENIIQTLDVLYYLRNAGFVDVFYEKDGYNIFYFIDILEDIKNSQNQTVLTQNDCWVVKGILHILDAAVREGHSNPAITNSISFLQDFLTLHS